MNQYEEIAIDEEMEYDPFIKKWIKKRKARRATKPRVIARRKRKGKSTASPVKRGPIKRRIIRLPIRRNRRKQEEIKTVTPRKVTPIKASESNRTLRSPGIEKSPILLTKKQAKIHKNVNKAIQNELKTKQEDLKVKVLESKVDQDKAKTDQIDQQAKLMGAVKIAGGVLLVGFGLHYFFGKSSNPNPQVAH